MVDKKCSKCDRVLPLSQFHKRGGVRTGVEAQCKECRKAYFDSRKEQKALYDAAYREVNKERLTVGRQDYFDSRKGVKKEYDKERRETLKHSITEQKKAYGKGPANFSKYASRLSVAESASETETGLLQAACANCGTRFLPSVNSVVARISSLGGKTKGECRLYCSDECKSSCSVFGRRPGRYKDPLYNPFAPKDNTRPLQPELRQMALDLYGHKCERCGDTDKPLIAHHIDPVKCNPVESADLDNMVILCEDCHELSHKLPGCGNYELGSFPSVVGTP
jgi:5-methylcytosine-specific restriction endonuclease McrA